MEFFTGYNAVLYLIAVTIALLAVERFAPWRRERAAPIRWLRNASMNFYGTILLGLLPFLSDVGIAHFAREKGIGLLNNVSVSGWAALLFTLIAVDLTAFVQHRALHKWPLLWRLHRAHHTDATIDVTTGLRFHPFETIFRAATEGLVILALGIPYEGLIFAFAVLVVINSIGHANVDIPVALERFLSHVFITPRAHRLHHATAPEFYNSNFGTIFSLWDRASRTWKKVDALKDDQKFGLEGAQAPEADTFGNLALDPFRGGQAAGARPAATPTTT